VADHIGWIQFFLLTTVVTLPALALLIWIARSSDASPHAPEASQQTPHLRTPTTP
jgi:predicted MFS family arabinose efflux permease